MVTFPCGGYFDIRTYFAKDDKNFIAVEFRLRAGCFYRVEEVGIDTDGYKHEGRISKKVADHDDIFEYEFEAFEKEAHRIRITEISKSGRRMESEFIVTKEYLRALEMIDWESRREARFNKALTNEHVDDIKRRNSQYLFVGLKDDGGETKSRSAGKLEGFYLGTRMASDGEPLPSNPFGNNLFLFNHDRVIKEHSNLYFNGFYCYHGKRWCKRNLVRLKIHDNPFLYVSDSNKLKSSAYLLTDEQLFVEVFVCDTNLSIRGLRPRRVEMKNGSELRSPRRSKNCRRCC